MLLEEHINYTQDKNGMTKVPYSISLLFICNSYIHKWASLVAQMVKKMSAMQKTWVCSLGQEDALEKEMATQSSILAWEVLWTEDPGGLQIWGSHGSDTN